MVYALIITADFSKRQIGIISRRIQEAWILIARSEKEIELVARDARLPVKDLRRSIRQVRRNFDGSGQESLCARVLVKNGGETLIVVCVELRKIRKIEKVTGMTRVTFAWLRVN